MRTFLVELTVDVDDDEPMTTKDIRQAIEDIDPDFGIFTVQNISEERKSR